MEISEYAARARRIKISKNNSQQKALRAQEGKPPQIRKLAKTYEQALDMCKACNKTGLIKEKDEEQRLRILNLEKQLSEKTTVRMKVPVCQMGAILSHDATEFTMCPKSKQPVNIANYCKKYNRGLPCSVYRESTLGFSEKEPDHYPDDHR